MRESNTLRSDLRRPHVRRVTGALVFTGCDFAHGPFSLSQVAAR